MVMIKIKFQTQGLYSVQLKSLNILHSQGTCAFYLHNVQCIIYFIQVTTVLPLLGVSRHDQGLPVPKK